MTMPIPDWAWRETRYIHAKAFHVLSAIFVEGRAVTLENGETVMAYAEELPLETGIVAEAKTLRTVWAQLERRGLVRYQAEDHMALSGRKKGSYVASLQDPIRKFSDVPNKVRGNFPFLPAGAPFPEPEFESEARRLSRAYAGDNIPRDPCAATQHPTTATTTTPTSSPATTAPQVVITNLEEALEAIGFTEDGQAGELLVSFGANNVAVSVRYLVRALKRSKRKLQPPIGSLTGYVIQHLGANAKSKFAEVDDFGFLGELAQLLCSPSVIEFRKRGE